MIFPWNRFEELPLHRRNTLQIFITGKCNLNCEGCFARKLAPVDIGYDEYCKVIATAKDQGVEQINLIGGEPFIHSKLRKFVELNAFNSLRTTVYTNGSFLPREYEDWMNCCKFRVGLHHNEGKTKSVDALPHTEVPIEVCFMISRTTRLNDLRLAAYRLERNWDCRVFFISSLREMDNLAKDFFVDTTLTMPLLWYKKMVHGFLETYYGDMDVHISKRGVFESTVTLPDCHCRFANYIPGGKYIQCPYDLVNENYQDTYTWGSNAPFCHQNNTCLMSKIIVRRRK